MQPSATDLHVNVPLSNVSVAFMQDQTRYIADRVFPSIPVDHQSDMYYVGNRGDWNKNNMEKRAPATESKGTHYRLSKTPYFAPVWALHKDIDDQTRANGDSVFNQDRTATTFLTQQALLSREINFASDFLKTGVWGTDITGVTSSPTSGQVLKWTDGTSDPIGDIDTAMATVLLETGMEPNTMTVGYKVAQALRKHPDIIDRVKYTQNIGPNQAVKVNDEALANLFGVSRFFVMRAIENTAIQSVDSPSAETNVFVGGNDALLTYSPESAGRDIASAGYTFNWRGYLGATDNGTRIKRFRMEHIEVDRIEIEQAYAQVVIAPELGYFFDEIV